MEVNREHIRALLFEKIAGTISESDDQLVTAAIENDADVAALWQQIHQALEHPESQQFIHRINESQRWEQIKNNLQPVRTKVSPLRTWRAAAAAVLVLLTAAGVYYFSRSTVPLAQQSPPPVANTLQLRLANGKDIPLPADTNHTIAAGPVQLVSNGRQLTYTVPENAANEWATLMVPGKLDYRIVLKDGTEVWLNSLSSLRFPYIFSEKNREVFLTGEAYFKVAPQTTHPFIVHAGETTIEVLATSFNIHAYEPGTVTTSLVEGAVITRAKGVATRLTPGYQSVYTNGKFTTLPFDTDNTLAWMNGRSHFRDATLSSIAAIITRWYDVPIVFDNPALAHETLSGAIDKRESLDVFLTNIAISSGVQHYYKDNVLHLK